MAEGGSGENMGEGSKLDPLDEISFNAYFNMIDSYIKQLSSAIEENRKRDPQAVSDLYGYTDRGGEILGSLHFALGTLYDKFRELKQQSDSRSNNLTAALNELDLERRRTSDLTEKLDATQRQYRELKMLGDAADFWSAKAKRHKRGWIVSISAFCIIGIVALTVLISWWPSIRDMLPKNDAGDLAFAGISVLFLLALVPVWILKLVSRFFYQSLLLADDAKARETMIFTYLALVGNPDAHMRPEERSFMLHNVFRTNHAAPDEPVPSSLIEALAKVVEKAGKN